MALGMVSGAVWLAPLMVVLVVAVWFCAGDVAFMPPAVAFGVRFSVEAGSGVGCSVWLVACNPVVQRREKARARRGQAVLKIARWV